MSSSFLPALLFFFVVGGWCGLILLAAVLAYRGRRYWATRLMLIGGTLQGLGAIGMTVASFFPMMRYGSEFYPAAMIISTVTTVMIPVGMLMVAGGMIGVCGSYRALHQRAGELETLNLQLQDRLSE